jgi:hypothetical protein
VGSLTPYNLIGLHGHNYSLQCSEIRKEEKHERKTETVQKRWKGDVQGAVRKKLKKYRRQNKITNNN